MDSNSYIDIKMTEQKNIFISPSNIALIKYMGKERGCNAPSNPSFSYTLDHLISGVKLTPIKKEDDWSSLEGKEWTPLQMNDFEKNRFLVFFKKLKKLFYLKQNYLVQSANNFPKSAGIASSASSFSALTQAVYQQSLKEKTYKQLNAEELALISRQGSGSSCRSFFKPWCLWNQDQIQSVSLPIQKLEHDFIVLSKGTKTVSSSEAHQRVRTSPYFQGRPQRVQERLEQLLSALKNQKWKEVYQTVREEFEDMHRLFETSQPGFSYRNDRVKTALKILNQFWKDHHDGPLVTMDAGACIHLLYRCDQQHIRRQIQEQLKGC